MTDKPDTKNAKKMAVAAGRVARDPDEDTFAPLVDIYETGDGTTVLSAEMPGAKQDSIDIRVDKGVLTVSAAAGATELSGEYARTYVGFTGGQYFRAFALSDAVDRDRIEASLADGVLTLCLPPATAAQTQKIPIKAL